MSGVIPAPGANSSGSKFKRRSYTPIADINVTPLVDVMLVLLIIFMVAAPLLTVGVPVQLPKTAAEALPTEQEEPSWAISTNGPKTAGLSRWRRIIR